MHKAWGPGELARAVGDVWRPLTPPLDERATEILKAMIESREPMTLYKVSKKLGLSFSVAYKKGRVLEQNRLTHQAGKSGYTATVKACIAGVARGFLDEVGFYSCLSSRWPLRSLGVTAYEAASLLYALGVTMRARGLDLTKATICNFDEASMHIFKVYLASVVAQSYLTHNVKGLIEEIAGRWGVPAGVVAAAFRAAVKGVLAFVPPTVVTPKHRILLVLHSGVPRVIGVDCKMKCKYYEEEVGLTCPNIASEAAKAVALAAGGGGSGAG